MTIVRVPTIWLLVPVCLLADSSGDHGPDRLFHVAPHPLRLASMAMTFRSGVAQDCPVFRGFNYHRRDVLVDLDRENV